MGILDGLKKIGLVQDDEPKEVKTEVKKTTTSIPSTPQQIQSNFQTNPVPQIVDNGEYSEYLQKVFAERNFPGPDYYEFVEGLKKLSNSALDENTKFVTLFAGLSAAGLTKEKLLETAQKYKAFAQAEQATFKAEVKNALDTEVASKEKTLQQFNDDNAQIEQQMIALTERKNKNYVEITRLSKEISDDKQTLALKEASFNSAVQIFNNNIDSNIQKINLFL